MSVGLTGCLSHKLHSPAPVTSTDENIILRCRSHLVTTSEVDKELGDWVEWQNLKANIKPGDELWRFCTPGLSWEEMMGWAGFALFRNGKLVGSVTTSEN